MQSRKKEKVGKRKKQEKQRKSEKVGKSRKKEKVGKTKEVGKYKKKYRKIIFNTNRKKFNYL